MPKSKKRSSRPSVKVKDLSPRKNPKGGKASQSDISIKKLVDKSSPTL
jgi:hypothetical protein